ncbi:unnamed protein product [Rotaria sp. Silwood2]|nr:unnamed protein product [Rotaria sp. Silwood2]CAF4436009.1 unnamed protein product [Rotaria sp. Silwood2]
MTATQTSEYYDIWALRSWPTLTFDCWHRIRHLTFLPIAQSFLVQRLIHIHQEAIPRDHPLIEVQSAFGGAAIYVAEYISDECVYNGWADQGLWFLREQCEHVSFNECVRRRAGGGKVFINPQFQIY